MRTTDRKADHFMDAALAEAAKAGAKGEVPIGAVVVSEGKIIGRGHNVSITRNDPAGHAEIVALRQAARKRGNYRLSGCTLYVTVEPCPMCAGALIWARVERVVFGAHDEKAGACGSVCDLPANTKFNHRVTVTGGVKAAECRGLLQDFFRERRAQRRTAKN